VFVGYVSGSGDIDPGIGVVTVSPPAGAFYLFVIKVDAQGNTLFTKVITCNDVITPSALTTDASGNIYVTGGFGGTVDFDPGVGVYNLVSAGNLDYFVLKLNASGDFVWAKRTGNLADGYGLGITVDGSGNVYTAIYFQSTIDFDPGVASFTLTAVSNPDCCVQKLDANGNFVWARQIVTSLSMGLSGISTDNNDNLIIYGNYEGVIDMNPGSGSANFTSVGEFDLYVMKWTSSGTYVWGRSFGSAASEYQKQFTLDNSGNVILTGIYSATIDLNPNAEVFNQTPIGNYDAFIVKLDNAGNFVFGGSIGGLNLDDIIYGMDSDVNDNIYLTGGFSAGTTDFDPGAGSYDMTTAVTQSYLLKLSPTGSFIWAYQLNATVNSITTAITIDETGSIYSFGRFNGTVDFDPTFNDNTITVESSRSFIQKLSQCLNTISNLAITSCESYSSPSGNYTWLSSGIYQDIIPNVAGCDSIITINLTIVNAAAPSGSENQSFCNSATISDISISGIAIQWYDAASGGIPLLELTELADLTSYYASQTVSSCESAARLEVTVSINAPASPSGSANQSFCSSGTISNLVASGSSIQWYASANGGSPLVETTTLINGTTYYASQTISGCESSSRLAVTAIINVVSDVSTSLSGNIITANNASANYAWLNCTDNFSVIEGEIGQSFTPSSNESFAVQLTENGCVDTSDCVSFLILDINENAFGKHPTVFPNPNNGNFKIVLDHSLDQILVEIFDLQGRIIQSQKFTQMKILDLTLNEPAGIYIVSISSQQEKTVMRIVKE
jgi:hypothetical protein